MSNSFIRTQPCPFVLCSCVYAMTELRSCKKKKTHFPQWLKYFTSWPFIDEVCQSPLFSNSVLLKSLSSNLFETTWSSGNCLLLSPSIWLHVGQLWIFFSKFWHLEYRTSRNKSDSIMQNGSERKRSYNSLHMVIDVWRQMLSCSVILVTWSSAVVWDVVIEAGSWNTRFRLDGPGPEGGGWEEMHTPELPVRWRRQEMHMASLPVRWRRPGRRGLGGDAHCGASG